MWWIFFCFSLLLLRLTLRRHSVTPNRDIIIQISISVVLNSFHTIISLLFSFIFGNVLYVCRQRSAISECSLRRFNRSQTLSSWLVQKVFRKVELFPGPHIYANLISPTFPGQLPFHKSHGEGRPSSNGSCTIFYMTFSDLITSSIFPGLMMLPACFKSPHKVVRSY